MFQIFYGTTYCLWVIKSATGAKCHPKPPVGESYNTQSTFPYRHWSSYLGKEKSGFLRSVYEGQTKPFSVFCSSQFFKVEKKDPFTFWNGAFRKLSDDVDLDYNKTPPTVGGHNYETFWAAFSRASLLFVNVKMQCIYRLHYFLLAQKLAKRIYKLALDII